MAVLVVKIPDVEMSWLDALAKTQHRSKTEIVRSALRREFEENFIDRTPLLVSEDEFHAIVAMVDQPLTKREAEGRKRLEAARMWELRE